MLHFSSFLFLKCINDNREDRIICWGCASVHPGHHYFAQKFFTIKSFRKKEFCKSDISYLFLYVCTLMRLFKCKICIKRFKFIIVWYMTLLFSDAVSGSHLVWVLLVLRHPGFSKMWVLAPTLCRQFSSYIL